MKKFSEKLARFIQRHPVWIIVTAVLFSAAAVPGITLLETETGFSALISNNDKISVDTARYEAQFGGESINVLITGNIDAVFSSDNLKAFVQFENSVNADSHYQAVQGPLTILNIAVEKAEQSALAFQQQVLYLQEQAAEEARTMAAAAGLDEAQQELAAEEAKAGVLAGLQPQLEAFAQIGELSLENPVFVRSVLYDNTGAINPELARFVPDDNHAIVSIIPDGNMSDAEKLEATRVIEEILSESGLSGIEASVVSYPEIIDSIAAGLADNLKILLGLSVLAMIIILYLLFRVRWRLLPLVMVGISALWTFGLMGYLSIPLTMTSMAVLPILIGLGIDFSIQFQNRYQEELIQSRKVDEAVVTALSHMVPLVGIALMATIIGFITLYISEIPMIRDFGLVLAIGIVISYVVGLFLLHSIIALADRKTPVDKLTKTAAKESRRINKVLTGLGRLAIRHTAWIFIISVLFAAGGGWVDHLLPVNTDYEQLMQQDSPALQELRDLRDILGVGGSITLMIEGDGLDSAEKLSWMNNFENEIVDSHPEILSVNSPAAIVSRTNGGVIPPQQQIDIVLEATPGIFRDRVISNDGKAASLSFTIRYITLEEVHGLIADILERAEAPEGITVSPVGSMVTGAKIMDSVVNSRMTMNIICLSAIFLILLVVYRRLDRTIFSVIPVAVVIAWSSLDMYLTGIPINPLTAILGVLVIGICTEFMILLTGRYEEEKSRGLALEEAMVTAISHIGRAIIASAVTTLGGFGVLIASDFVMIRDFGIVTLIGVLLCLVITITVMPGIIVWYDTLRLKRQARKEAEKAN